MRKSALALLAAVLLVAADDADAKKDAANLQGTWEVVSREIGGEKSPAEDLPSFRLTVKGVKMSHKGGDKGDVEELTFQLDTTQKPKAIDLTAVKGQAAGKPILGIYSLEGDVLKVCLDPVSAERPKAFESKPKSGVTLIVFKRGSKPKP